MSALDGLPLSGLDVEGDGNSPIMPVETAVIRPDGSHIEVISDPGRPINPYATRVHGLTDADVADAPGFDRWAPLVREALEGSIVVGHGIGGDLAVMRRMIPDLAVGGSIDTLTVARRCLRRKTNLRLHDLALELDVTAPRHPGRGPHSALHDAALGLALLRRLDGMFPDLVATHLRDAGLINRQASLRW
jgi:DNA polymerase III epsilon subunit-like protein